MKATKVKVVTGEPKVKLFGAPCAMLGPEHRFWLNIDGLDVMVSTAKFKSSDDAVKAGITLLRPLGLIRAQLAALRTAGDALATTAETILRQCTPPNVDALEAAAAAWRAAAGPQE